MGKKDNPDFKKVKKKLGKPAKGVTTTNLQFQTRAIHMPEQSVAEEKGEFVTNRNLSLDALLPQLKHHNDNVRKDALLGIKDLLTTYPQLITPHLAVICERIVETMVDLERQVRQALHTLLDQLLPLLSDDIIAPFFPLFLVYMTSALTHLKQSIRLDAVAFINLWIKYFPNLISSQHHKFLRHFVTVLLQREPAAAGIPRVNSSYTSDLAISGEKVRRLQRTDAFGKKIEKLIKNRAGAPTPLQAKMSVLNSLFSLLQHKLETLATQSSQETSSTFFATYQRNVPHYAWQPNRHNAVHVVRTPNWGGAYTLDDVFEGLRATSILTRDAEKPVGDSVFTLPSPSSGTSSSMTSLGAPVAADVDYNLDSPVHLVSGIRSFFARLAPLLMMLFVECEPDKLETLSTVAHLQLILSTYEALLRHVRASFADDVSAAQRHLSHYLSELLKYVLPYFPFECPAGWSDAEVAETNALNIIAAKVLSLFLVPRTRSERVRTGAGSDDDDADAIDVEETQQDWVRSLFIYVSGAFHGKLQFRHKRASAPETQVLKERLTKSEYGQLVELLPVMKAMLSSTDVSPVSANTLIDSFNQIFKSCPAKSSAKRECIHFIADILLGGTAVTRVPAHAINDWLANLPKVLWQIQDSNPGASLVILKVLKHQGIEISSSSSPEKADQFEALQKALVPFFYTEVHDAKKGITRAVFGPFVSLPTEVQRAALELLYYFRRIGTSMLNALVRCVTAVAENDSDAAQHEPKYCVDVSVVRFMLETISHPASISSLPTYVGFLLSIFLASCKLDNDQRPSWRRVRDVTRAIAWHFHSLQLGSKMLHLFDETILKLVLSAESADVVRAAIYFLGRCCKLSLPAIVALPSSMERDYTLATGMYRYLASSCLSSSQNAADVKPCANLFRIYPGNLFRPVLVQLLEEVRRGAGVGHSSAVSEVAKNVFFAFISTHQRRLTEALRHECKAVLAVRDAILLREPNTNYSLRMEAELNVLYNL